MLFAESETVELKSVYVEDIKKEIIAFANTRGGTIYIGVEDNGSVCGVENADVVMQQVMNASRDHKARCHAVYAHRGITCG